MGWAETPKADRHPVEVIKETPGASKRRSRWDETPALATPGGGTPSMTTPGGATPMGSTPGPMTPSAFTPSLSTPVGIKAMGLATPTPGHMLQMTPEQKQAWTLQKELDERNRYMTDEEIDAILPEGFKVLWCFHPCVFFKIKFNMLFLNLNLKLFYLFINHENLQILPPPAGYVPIRTPGRKLTATPTPMANTPAGFRIQTPDARTHVVDLQPQGVLFCFNYYSV